MTQLLYNALPVYTFRVTRDQLVRPIPPFPQAQTMLYVAFTDCDLP